MKEKLTELCNNREFAEKLNSLKTEAEVVEFLKSNGIEINSLEELKTLAQPESKELDVDELNQAAGGVFVCLGPGLGSGGSWCWDEGASTDDSTGYGGGFCLVLGAGLGVGLFIKDKF